MGSEMCIRDRRMAEFDLDRDRALALAAALDLQGETVEDVTRGLVDVQYFLTPHNLAHSPLAMMPLSWGHLQELAAERLAQMPPVETSGKERASNFVAHRLSPRRGSETVQMSGGQGASPAATEPCPSSSPPCRDGRVRRAVGHSL